MSGILLAVLIVGGTGLLIGLFLGFAGKKFYVEVDEKEEKILDVLPGNNCGGCGYAGCSGLANAIAKGEAPVNGCPVGGDKVGALVAEIMGQKVEAKEKQVAFVGCGGDNCLAKPSYNYTGVDSCKAASMMPGGGPKMCSYGCLGFGDCVKACPFDAIHIVNGISVVDKEQCKACGKCVAACPKNIISLVPYESKELVRCVSEDKGKPVMDSCEYGCIGCGLCEKNCPEDAIHVINNHAVKNMSKCTHCGICMEKCPRKCMEY